jgi:hypothetical protein
MSCKNASRKKDNHELQERMKQKVLGEMHAHWVNTSTETGRDRRTLDYETFLRETDVLNPDDTLKSKLQKTHGELFFESVVLALFEDWVYKQRAQGRDERELVFGAFVSEEGYLVPNPPTMPNNDEHRV